MLVVLTLPLAGCMGEDRAFSMREGFEEIRRAQSDELPTASEAALLERFKPQLFVAAGEEGPIDFYADYISQGCLEVPGRPADCAVDRLALNEVKGEPAAVFTHRPEPAAITPVAYGSVYRATVELDGVEPARRDWVFLRYHWVFRHSGIATGVTGWQEMVMRLVGDLRDWHQLDHYTSAVVVLDEAERPVAVMLQQHNYMHTYLVGQEPAFPRDGTFKIDIAQRSNELYPHRPEPADRRAANFLSGDLAAWVVGATDKAPLTGTTDGTRPDREVDYEIVHLPPSDAFYVFTGKLGASRRMPGRDGPPGAIYYTLPEIWPYEISMHMFYWSEPDHEFAQTYSDVGFSNILAPLPAQRRRLTAAMAAAGLL